MRKITILGSMLISIFSNSQTVKDIDGNNYDTVIIGKQIWLKQNLKVTRFNNGDSIQKVTDNTTWSNFLKGYRASYENLNDNQNTYGSLYNWLVVSDNRKVCPTGYKVPSTDDWAELSTYLGGDAIAGSELKEVGNLHWNASQGISSTNSSRFTVLPNGYRGDGGAFGALKTDAYLWSKTEFSSTDANGVNLTNSSNNLTRGHYNKKNGFAIRCVREGKLALNEMEQNEIEVYPNPSKTFIIKNIPSNVSKIQIMSIEGRVIKEVDSYSTHLTFDLYNLNSGTYTIVFIGENMLLTKKVSVD